MSDVQRKNIIKTVIIIVAIMVTILLLFLNKIMTPRYLSDIELKINKLELIKEPIILDNNIDKWLLIAGTTEHTKILTELNLELRDSIQEKTNIVEFKQLSPPVDAFPYDPQEHIGIANAKGELIAYFRPPFDQHKMILTYSSVITHR
ncbi:MAG: hypothetical protein ACRBCI_04910 [Cellvibrionaceae bacterium]